MNGTQNTKALIASLISASRIVALAAASAGEISDIYTDAPECAASVAAAQNLGRLFSVLSRDSDPVCAGTLWVDGVALGVVNVWIDGAVSCPDLTVPSDGSSYCVALPGGSLLKLAIFGSEEGDVDLVVDEPDRFYEVLLSADSSVHVSLGTQAIIASFQPEEWQSHEYRPIGDAQDVDVTSEVLACDLDTIHAMEDDTDSTNDLVCANELIHAGGPHRITVVKEICEFFEVKQLEDITQEALDAARAAHPVAGEQPV